MKSLDWAVNGSSRLYLHGRCEPFEKDSPAPVTIFLPHYLTLVANADHRRALTRLLLSQHGLAIESLRYDSRYYWRVERPLRLCRFGCSKVETVEHAIFFCSQNDILVHKREVFYRAVSTKVPAVLSVQAPNTTEVLKMVVFRRDTVCQIAKFASQTFKKFASLPLRRPLSSRRPRT
ncbi:hypothetical protein C8J57DRAFT_1067332 [Mycena rebaudengoi]|nr:hypothetical protein C8J57DRAFT_1067332 [Mycena rebaudengoi]